MRLYFFFYHSSVYICMSRIFFFVFFSRVHIKNDGVMKCVKLINNFLVSALYWKKKRRNHDDRWKKTENKAALINVWKFVKVLMKCVCVCALKMYCAFLSPKLFKLCEIILFSLQTYYFFVSDQNLLLERHNLVVAIFCCLFWPYIEKKYSTVSEYQLLIVIDCLKAVRKLTAVLVCGMTKQCCTPNAK